MAKYNLTNSNSIETNYNLGLLPQRNNKDLWYFDTSSRSNLLFFQISSENRRIINKTQDFSYFLQPLSTFDYNSTIQKNIHKWINQLGWDFPINSVKKIFTNHIFNYIYIWKDKNNQIVAYSICYFSSQISHIAYVFYDPKLNHGNVPIRLVLQTIIDSQNQNLKYCYLGRFSPETGYYKRNMPGFEYFQDGNWIKYEK
jgi:arginyl-tRNA--protein-N-Asp/Glu arginylyltransferase